MGTEISAQSSVYESRPWLKSYPKGMPKEIDLGNYRNLSQMIAEACEKYGDSPAFTNMGHSLSFLEVRRLTLAFASYLQNELKLQKGDRIAIQSPNLLQYPIALFGALEAGLVVVNTNPLYTHREMAFQFKDSGRESDRDPRKLRR